MNKTTFKKFLIGIIVFVILWWLSAVLAFAGVIITSFALRNNPHMNLEMGWMAIIIVIPPVMAFLISIPATLLIMKKINRKIDKKSRKRFKL